VELLKKGAIAPLLRKKGGTAPFLIPKCKVKYVRCDRRCMFFLVPIHGVGIPKKKIHLDGISEFLLGATI